ncbi:MAG: MCE family protein [Betaproteobacteria bacterium HGW-Betaproteobacteria-10]|nr:MAG: MCE family protein [Betaproteobacteria bacterium HGW-Betaproteobacteria-10]
METKVNYALVGGFVLILGAMLVGAVLWIASGGAFQVQYDLYMAIEDESVAGLNLNAPLKYNGVNVGKVEQIHLDPENPERVILLLAIERDTPIKENTVATLKTQGLTGIAYVELSGGTKNSPPLRVQPGNEYPVIRTAPSISARLENVLTTVLGKLDSTSSNLNTLLGPENQASFKNALADIASVAHTIAGRNKQLDASLINADRSLQNTARASAQLGPLLEHIERSARAVEKMGEQVAETSASAGQTVNTIGADVKRFSAESLPELERLLGELNALSRTLRRLAEQTERDPNSLLFGRSPVPNGPGESLTPATAGGH